MNINKKSIKIHNYALLLNNKNLYEQKTKIYIKLNNDKLYELILFIINTNISLILNSVSTLDFITYNTTISVS